MRAWRNSAALFFFGDRRPRRGRDWTPEGPSLSFPRTGRTTPEPRDHSVSETRDAFLARVRRAVEEGNVAGGRPALPERGAVGRQGAGADPVARLRDELTAAG